MATAEWFGRSIEFPTEAVDRLVPAGWPVMDERVRRAHRLVTRAEEWVDESWEARDLNAVLRSQRRLAQAEAWLAHVKRLYPDLTAQGPALPGHMRRREYFRQIEESMKRAYAFADIDMARMFGRALEAP